MQRLGRREIRSLPTSEQHRRRHISLLKYSVRNNYEICSINIITTQRIRVVIWRRPRPVASAGRRFGHTGRICRSTDWKHSMATTYGDELATLPQSRAPTATLRRRRPCNNDNLAMTTTLQWRRPRDNEDLATTMLQQPTSLSPQIELSLNLCNFFTKLHGIFEVYEPIKGKHLSQLERCQHYYIQLLMYDHCPISWTKQKWRHIFFKFFYLIHKALDVFKCVRANKNGRVFQLQNIKLLKKSWSENYPFVKASF